MKPKLSYTIWFSQRTGSTLLYKALESTGIAGEPREWFNCPPDPLTTYRKTDHAELQDYLWKLGSTDNGVFGISHSYYEPQKVSENKIKGAGVCPALSFRAKRLVISSGASRHEKSSPSRNKISPRLSLAPLGTRLVEMTSGRVFRHSPRCHQPSVQPVFHARGGDTGIPCRGRHHPIEHFLRRLHPKL